MDMMSYNEIFAANGLLRAVPLSVDGRTAGRRTAVKLLLLKGAYSRAVAEFEQRMQAALAQLKDDGRFKGFDELAAAVGRMERTAERLGAHDEWTEATGGKRPARPSAKELEEAEATAERLEEFGRMRDELSGLYREVRLEAGREMAESPGRMDEETYAGIVEMMGVEGEIEVAGRGGAAVTVGRAELLERLAALVGQTAPIFQN